MWGDVDIDTARADPNNPSANRRRPVSQTNWNRVSTTTGETPKQVASRFGVGC